MLYGFLWLVLAAHPGPSPATAGVGTVSFQTSCAPAAQEPFNRAVAYLHSFEFLNAISLFGDVSKADPSCGMAYWGIALSRWGNPFAIGQKSSSQLAEGHKAIGSALQAGLKTERERAYVAAASELYESPEHRSQRERILAYRDAMSLVASKYSDDMEASIFYALSLAAAAQPTDKSYADFLKAGAILEPLFATHPDHPGLAHYIIHSYDVPQLAPRALGAASRYAKIAPVAPHALHMPSHTFTRVGYWQESIDTNIASAAAAKRDGSTSEELHATDYCTYAYLQTAQDSAARRMLDSLPEIRKRFQEDLGGSAAPPSAGYFALAAIPARWALERRAWAEAALIEPRESAFPYIEAMAYYARALGASRIGEIAKARSAVEKLQEIRDSLKQSREAYWSEQVEIERRTAGAWLTLAEGRSTDALAEMRTAADEEDATEKSAVTPGPLAPARELLGEMLLELHEPLQALQAFEGTLLKEPNRFRAIYGAARAAAAAGNGSQARTYYGSLVKLCVRGDSRPELVEAKHYLEAP